MAIEQKRRSLYSGMPAGLNFIDGQEVGLLPLNEVPYELECIILKWMILFPETQMDRNPLTGIVRDDQDHGLCLTEVGWSSFVTWMLVTLKKEQAQKDFMEDARELFYKSRNETFD